MAMHAKFVVQHTAVLLEDSNDSNVPPPGKFHAGFVTQFEWLQTNWAIINALIAFIYPGLTLMFCPHPCFITCSLKIVWYASPILLGSRSNWCARQMSELLPLLLTAIDLHAFQQT